MLYTKETLDFISDIQAGLVVEFNNGDLEVGTLEHSKRHTGHYCLTPPQAGYSVYIPLRIHFSRSQIKRIIYLGSGYTVPKDIKNLNHKMGKSLNILELNELVNKAGYEFI